MSAFRAGLVCDLGKRSDFWSDIGQLLSLENEKIRCKLVCKFTQRSCE